MKVLTPVEESKILFRIWELEQIHDYGDETYTDTFELEELRNVYNTALRLIYGGKHTSHNKKAG